MFRAEGDVHVWFRSNGGGRLQDGAESLTDPSMNALCPTLQESIQPVSSYGNRDLNLSGTSTPGRGREAIFTLASRNVVSNEG
jgi:hypothetical protein